MGTQHKNRMSFINNTQFNSLIVTTTENSVFLNLKKIKIRSHIVTRSVVNAHFFLLCGIAFTNCTKCSTDVCKTVCDEQRRHSTYRSHYDNMNKICSFVLAGNSLLRAHALFFSLFVTLSVAHCHARPFRVLRPVKRFSGTQFDGMNEFWERAHSHTSKHTNIHSYSARAVTERAHDGYSIWTAILFCFQFSLKTFQIDALHIRILVFRWATTE